MLRKSFDSRPVTFGISKYALPRDGKRKILAFRIRGLIAAVAGLLLLVVGLATTRSGLDASVFAALIGAATLTAGMLCVFARSLPAGNATSRTIVPPALPEDARVEDLKDAQWRLSDSAVRYRELLEAQRDFIIRYSPDGRVAFANSAFLEAFDLFRDEVLGAPYRPRALRTEQAINSSGPGRRIVELLPMRKGKRWIAWDETEVATPEGKIEIQRVGRDVTVEREIEEKLREARNRAETANRQKSRFLAAMSHEIRTPMNGIIGMISLLRDTKLNAEQRNYARVADDSARALMGLLDSILDFSKIEAGKLELASHVFSLRDCIAQMMQLMAPEAAAKNLSFTSTISESLPEWVQGDKMRLRQIILNLLSNAIKFTDTGGVAVRMDLAEDKGTDPDVVRVVIEVSDSGIGFSPDAACRLFEEFEQEENASQRSQGGTGLGLAISKRLAQAMSGEIVASPAGPHKGAVFTAVLELRGAREPASVAPTLEYAGGSDSRTGDVSRHRAAAPRFSVLVAEDNQISALLASKIIERAGGEAFAVGDGRSAITAMWETLERKRPAFDLILMDVLMPEIDGLTATKSIKALFAERGDPSLPCPPIIALTANAFAEDRERCRAAGMDDYLAKPFDARDLHALLMRWTAHSARATPPAA